MGLLQNISILNAEPVDYTGATSEFYPSQLGWQMNKFIGWAGLSEKSGVPDGYSSPYSFQLPIKEGGMSCFSDIEGSGDVSDSSYLGLAKAFPTITLTGSGDIPDTSLSLIIQLASVLAGEGDITGSIQAISNMIASLSGSGDIPTTPLNLIIQLAAELIGSGTVVPTMKGFADMATIITVSGEIVTPESCAAAVWEALAIDHDNPGTLGEKLNNAASAGDPWGTVIPGSYSPGEAGYIIGTNLDEKSSDILTGTQNAKITQIDVDLLQDIVDALWDELKTNHQISNSFGKIVQDITGGGSIDPSAIFDENVAEYTTAKTFGKLLRDLEKMVKELKNQ